VEVTQDRIESLGLAYYRRESLRCPSCGMRPEAESGGGLGMSVFPVHFTCTCGWNADFKPVSNPEPYTEAQKSQILAGYGLNRSARCPRDQAWIKFHPSGNIGSNYLMANCLLCGGDASGER
jgi:hypothetical protein